LPYSRGECRLRSLRKAAGLKQIDVARRARLPRQLIWSFENDKRKMSPEAMYAVSQAVGCHMEELYPWIWEDNAE
jgi:transcriptional regulator with XRE-family HTH domain